MQLKTIGVIAIVFTSVFANEAWSQVKNIATVASVPVTEAELSRQLDKMMPFRVQFHGKISQEKIDTLRKEAVDLLIERAYKVCYAVDNEISVPAEEVDKQLAKIKKQFKSDAEFQQALAGESIGELRSSLYRELVAKKAEKQAIDSNVTITEADVKKYYEEKKQMFFMPQQFQASHILVKVDPASNKEERAQLLEKAEQLAAKAKAGEDFYNLAYFNSDDRTKYVGGDLGLFHEGQTAKPFEDTLKNMEVGEISDPVKTRWGYHIIKLVKKNPSRQLAYDEIKGKIRQQLEGKQRDQYYQQWLEQLEEECPVEMVND